MKGLGLILLFLGVGIVAYAFNASEAINTAVASAIAQVVARVPGNETIWLLLGGSGAMVVGMSMIFKRNTASSKR
jgi:hypothetical protein